MLPALAPSLSASRRHLSDLAFRFGPPTPVAVSRWTPPAPDGTWSLEDVLAALDRGAGVYETRSGLRLTHAHLRPGLADAVQEHADSVRLWIRLGLTNAVAAPSLRAWPRRVRLLVSWLDSVLLPSGLSLALQPGVQITDPVAFRDGVQSRLDAGPGAASARGLLADLDHLYEAYSAPLVADEATPRRRLAQAA